MIDLITVLIKDQLERDLRWYESLIKDCRKGTKDCAYLTGLKHGTLNAMRIVDSMEKFAKEITKTGQTEEISRDELYEPQTYIVRCKECRWLDKGENESCSWSMCTRHIGQYINVNADDYCSYGERKDKSEVITCKK